MISFDAVKGLLAEQWNKDIRDTVAKLRATGMVDAAALTPDGSRWPAYNPSRVQPAAK